MIERYDYAYPAYGFGNMNQMMGMGMGFGMPGMGMGYGTGYVQNRDAVTLRGPLSYDQFGNQTVQTKTKEKDSSLWKTILTTGALVGAGVLAWRTPAIKDVITKAGKYVVDLVKKFIK